MTYAKLKKRAEFSRVFQLGRTYGDRYMVLFVLSSKTAQTRVGFASKRSVGTAVRRNRVRRRLRSLYALYADKIVPCGDLIFLGKKSMIEAPWEELKRSMARVLRQAGCLEG
ncbi:MAG: ribonuclease P protein component [Firmicutes bacterium]|nr:ribonuclease P protein component [Bacillota bacterium]